MSKPETEIRESPTEKRDKRKEELQREKEIVEKTACKKVDLSSSERFVGIHVADIELESHDDCRLTITLDTFFEHYSQ